MQDKFEHFIALTRTLAFFVDAVGQFDIKNINNINLVGLYNSIYSAQDALLTINSTFLKYLGDKNKGIYANQYEPCKEIRNRRNNFFCHPTQESNNANRRYCYVSSPTPLTNCIHFAKRGEGKKCKDDEHDINDIEDTCIEDIIKFNLCDIGLGTAYIFYILSYYRKDGKFYKAPISLLL